MDAAHPAIHALVRHAKRVNLLPHQYAPCILYGGSNMVGGFRLLVTDLVPGQVLPSIDRTWLAFSPFSDTRAAHERGAAELESLLRGRMQFLVLLVELSMTRQCDWQSMMNHRRKPPVGAPPEKPFRWHDAIFQLVGGAWHSQEHLRSLASLRWSHPRFLLKWSYDPIADNFPSMLETFLSAALTRQTFESPEDDALRELLKDTTSGQWYPKQAPRHRVVELALAFTGGRITLSLLFNLIEVLERFGAAQRKQRDEIMAQADATSLCIEFRVRALVFQGSCVVASSALDHLGTLVSSAKDLHLNAIQLGQLHGAEDLRLQKCVSDLIRPCSSSKSKLRRLSCENHTKDAAAVFGSSLRSWTCKASPWLRELDFGHLNTQMHSFTAWLAFGLFHKDSDSPVTQVRLRMPINTGPPYAICTPQWIDVFKRVLGHVVSPEDLAPIDPKISKRKRATSEHTGQQDEATMPDDKQLFVAVKKNTKARQQPASSSPVVGLIGGCHGDGDGQDEQKQEDEEEEQSPILYQVLRKSLGWLAVVVPGFGAGWILAKAVLGEHLQDSRITPEDQSQVATNNKITSFAWIGSTLPMGDEHSQVHADALMDLLAIIGQPLVELHLPYMSLRSRHLESILRYCPKLKELNVTGNEFVDIAPLVRGYEDGTCKITTLSIAQEGKSHDKVVQQLAEILLLDQDADGTMGNKRRTTLERLAFRITPFPYDRLPFYLDEVIPQIHDAIEKAPALEYVRLHCSEVDFRSLREEFARLAVRRLSQAGAEGESQRCRHWTVSRSLPLCTRLAWCSVVQHESVEQSALSQMDAHIMALILDLAGTWQPRYLDFVPDAEE